MERKTFISLFSLLFVFTSAASHAESHSFGSDPSVFKGRAIVPQDAPEKKPFVDLYMKDRRGSRIERANYRTELEKRREQPLTKSVLRDFDAVLGKTTDLAIIYAEGINNNPLLGGKGKMDSFQEAARAFSELLGSIPRDEEKTMAGKIKDLRDSFEEKRERMEGDSDLTPEEKQELEYLKLGLWASDEATSMLKDGEEHKEAEGNDESQQFRKAFSTAFSEKLERNRKEHALFEKAAKGDPAAKKELIARNPVTLLTYAAQQKLPEKAAEAIRALSTGENNSLTLYDENNVAIPITFGKTPEEIQATLDKWRDRYASGSFSLQPLAKLPVTAAAPERPAATAQVPRAGASDDNVSRARPGQASAPQNAIAQNQALIAAQQVAAQREADRQRALEIVQQRAQQFNANRRAQLGQTAQGRIASVLDNQKLRDQAAAQLAQQQAARQAAVARFGLARLLESRRRASPVSYRVPGQRGGNVSASADPEGYMENRCASCHAVDSLPEQIRNADPNGILAQMPYDGTPMDETEKQALIDWANTI